MKNRSWLIFSILGAIFIYWGFHQILIIPTFPADHWDWLVPTPELLEYIKFRFQNLGAFTLANGFFILGVALTACAKGKDGRGVRWWSCRCISFY